MSNTPQIQQPDLMHPYTVIWYENGRLFVRGYASLNMAVETYNQLSTQYQQFKHRFRPKYELYVAVVIAGETNE